MNNKRNTENGLDEDIHAVRRNPNGSKRYMLIEGRLMPRNPASKYTRRYYINVEDIQDFCAGRISPKFGNAILNDRALSLGGVSKDTGPTLPAGDDLKSISYKQRKFVISKPQSSSLIYFNGDEFDRFNLMRFKNEVLYLSRGLPIPQRGQWVRFSDCKANGVCIIRHIKIHVKRIILRILMEGDPLLSNSDAELIYLGFRQMLEVKDYEYFFNRYILSEDINE
ncbi:hypothetical protein PAEPH01_0134 [Pancytospora epiphaga]|nr:hypothetical protein PAEPH01_0134 [Pancytospora epiphaga]